MSSSSNYFLRFLRKIKKVYLSVRHWIRMEPKKALIFGILIGALIFSIGFAEYFNIRSNSRGQELAAIPSMTIKQLQDDIYTDKVASITNASALVGGVLGQQYKFYMVVKFKDGKEKAVEQISPSRDEQWKNLAQDAKIHNFTILQGYNAFEEIPVMGFVSFAMLILFLIIALVVAQSLIGEVLSGFKFKPDSPSDLVSMDDVVGYEEVKREFKEVLEQLHNYDYYKSKNIYPARGILLTGDPGVGKTMIAKAVASTMNAEFFTCTGADFVEMYVGVGPKRVRALFHQARRTKKAVIFIDEIDALGSREQMNMDSERQATINRMLAELDGMSGNNNLLVIGATNFPDRLDKALRRPGRFDKIIHMPLPDLKTREGILKKYLEKTPLSEDVDTKSLALRTQAYSGAQLSQIVSEAKQLALREMTKDKKEYQVTQSHLEQGQEIAMMGIFEKNSEGPEARRAAIHELGHALVGHIFNPSHLVEKVTLKGRGDALAYMFSRPLSEIVLQTQEDLLGSIATLLGGRAAEEVILKSVSTGASNDLVRANKIAEQMVCFLGMGEKMKLRSFDPQLPHHQWPQAAEEDIRLIIEKQYKKACTLIEENKEWMENKTNELFAKKVLSHQMLFGDLDVPQSKHI